MIYSIFTMQSIISNNLGKKKSKKSYFRKLSAVAFVLGISILTVSVSSIPAVTKVQGADTVEQLNQKKAQLEAQAKAAQQAAEQQKTVAERASDRIETVSTQINEIQGSIQTTTQNISETTTKIGEQNQEIARLETELRKIKDQQDALVRQMYIMRQSNPDQLVYFSDEPISAREQRQAQMVALKKSVNSLMSKTQVAKTEVETKRTELVQKNTDLEMMKLQQDEQKRGLANYKYEQALLKDNAEDAVVALETKAEKAKQEAAKVEDSIRQELAKRTASSTGVFGTGPGVGQRVKRGDYVGIQGSTGFSTGDHVHFEVDMSAPAKNWTNPWPYLNNGTIVMPLSSYNISQDYGVRNSWYSCGYHMGIDIYGPYGSVVRAPADGLVVLHEYFGGYGNAWAMKVDNGPYVLMGHMRK